MNKKSEISRTSWWVFGIIGILFGLIKGQGQMIWIYAGVCNGLFWGWILGLMMDKIRNSLFHEEEKKTIKNYKSIKVPEETVLNQTPKNDDNSNITAKDKGLIFFNNINLLLDALNKIKEDGLDISDFKVVADEMHNILGKERFMNLFDDFKDLYNLEKISQNRITDTYETLYLTTKKEDKKTFLVPESETEYKLSNTTELKQNLKPKLKEPLPKSDVEEESDSSKIKYVGYIINFPESNKFFPVVKIPKQNCVVRTHRIGSTKRRGFKEDSFQKAIEYFFGEQFNISGNTRLNTGKNTRPFEPDIAIIGESKLNIKIDIEIDEPYAGITRQPTHCIGDDVNRDNYFRDRGWIVIRFSEYQVHTKEKECLKFIANIINLIDNSIQIPPELKYISEIEKENIWDIVQAQKWEKAKYREQYLNHEFKTIEQKQETTKRDFDGQEIEEENLVKPTSFGQIDMPKKIGFNKKNSHQKDKRIKFYSEKHIYSIDGVPAFSASTIISRFFPEFDAWGKARALRPSNPLFGYEVNEIVQIWKERGLEAASLGTFLHEQIEKFYLNQEYVETEEFYQFKNFVENHPDIEPYRSEWRIFDDNIGVAGTIDLIVKSEQGFDIYDWKRSKKIINPFEGKPIEIDTWGKVGIGKLNHIDDTSYNRYCLQQSLYKYILEQNYGIEVNNMFLIVMNPEYDNYYKVSVPYLRNEIEHILGTIR